MKEVTDTVAEQVPWPGTSGHPARLPALAFIAVSAVFHYLSPAFAVTRFARLDVSGVTWLRISAAVVFAAGRHPWLLPRRLTAGQRRVLLALGAVLAVKNTTFYLAIVRLPLATVGSVEFLAIIVLAVAGIRSLSNTLTLGHAVAGPAYSPSPTSGWPASHLGLGSPSRTVRCSCST